MAMLNENGRFSMFRSDDRNSPIKPCRILGMKTSKARFRMVLPVTYLLISGGLFAVCFLHIGHSSWCQYFLDSMFPAHLVTSLLLQTLLGQGLVAQASATWTALHNTLTVPIPYLLTLAQYYLLGLVVDRWIARRD